MPAPAPRRLHLLPPGFDANAARLVRRHRRLLRPEDQAPVRPQHHPQPAGPVDHRPRDDACPGRRVLRPHQDRAGRPEQRPGRGHPLADRGRRPSRREPVQQGARHPAQGSGGRGTRRPPGQHRGSGRRRHPVARSCSSCSRSSRTSIGSGFVDQLVNDGGQARVDQAFRKPPTSTLQIIDPQTRFLHRVDATVVAPPAPGAGRVVDHDVAGALALSAVLSEAAPTRWLLQTSVEAWAGDSYVTTKQGSRICVRDSIRTTSAAGRVKLGAALTAWARTHSGSSVAGDRQDVAAPGQLHGLTDGVP